MQRISLIFPFFRFTVQPAPQVSDAELEDIVKAGQNALMPPPVGLPTGGGAATQALLGDYSAAYKSTPTPLRTPMQENIIMQEARNLRTLRAMVPLSGEELPELEEGTGFEGVSPRSGRMATPNTFLGTPAHPGATPLRTPGSVAGSVAGSVGSSVASSRYGAPVLRDQLGLNDAHSDTFSVTDTSSFSSRMMRAKVRVGVDSNDLFFDNPFKSLIIGKFPCLHHCSPYRCFCLLTSLTYCQ